MNRTFIIGNLTKDPTLNTTPGGQTVCNFTVAVNRRGTKKNEHPEADFFRIAVWGQMAEACNKYLTKGKKVAVTGAVQVSTYTAQDGTVRAQLEIPYANEVEFLSPKDGGETGATAVPHEDPNAGFTPVETDELPF